MKLFAAEASRTYPQVEVRTIGLFVSPEACTAALRKEGWTIGAISEVDFPAFDPVAVADELEAAGIDHAFATLPYEQTKGIGWKNEIWGMLLAKKEVPAYMLDRSGNPLDFKASDALNLPRPGFPDFWSLYVQNVLTERAVAKRLAGDHVAVEAFEAVPPIKTLLRSRFGGHGFVRPAREDLSGWMRSAKSGVRQYQPEAGCPMVLSLDKAVLVGATQDAYADYSEHAVPVAFVGDIDLAVGQRNLNRFCEAIRTHNGFAGSGATHNATIHRTNEGDYVLFESRHSLSD